MPGQVLPLRLLSSSSSAAVAASALPKMRLAASLRSSRGHLIFGRVFPFKLRHLAFSARASSTRDRSDFRSGTRFGGKGKSLIDDEAEMSDWVSDLGRSSSRPGVGGGSRGAGRGRGRGGGGGGRGSGPPFRDWRENGGRSKRGRGEELEGRFDGRRPRGGFGPPSRGPRRFGDESDGVVGRGNEDFPSRSRGVRGSRSGFSSPPAKRGGAGSSRAGFPRGGSGLGRVAIQASEEEEEDSDYNESDLMSDVEEGLISESGDDKDVVMKDEFRSMGLLDESDTRAITPSTSKSTAIESEYYLSQTRFDQCPISPLSLKAIKAAGYERMTLVQEATLPFILKGKDVLAKAKTGTGKTIAFLLPAIEVVLKLPPVDRDQRRPPINVLVMCPTRELALQAAKEANTLLKYHPSIGVQVVIGGTRLSLEQKRMQANPCQILVATPGRLRDHIENTAGFASRLMGVNVLVLDEADHLLDMGFRTDIEKIVAAVPKQRQTLLFSATVPEEVRQVCHIALRRDHEFINTVEAGSEETHSQVRQMNLTAPLEHQFSMLYGILTEHISEEIDYKVLVFCTTAMVTRLVAELLSELKLNVREIHSRKTQSYRTRVSDEFRKSKGLILVTSDVSARGVDYPDVTLVIQVGLPSDRQQYIHRLGRTGRKGKEGKGILLLAPWEEFFLKNIKDLPITKAPMPLIDPDMRKKVERALSHVEMKDKESAYQAWLGYYNSAKEVGRDKIHLVMLANEFSRSMGLDTPPAISKKVIGKMGLKNVPGLRVN
ncbi:DEAD-box ATP-dependent RNA helicase 31 [Acorus calamus]|uniref:ATP-dependent RNA helicase n=1 Tax=Acorus calamus TaxID=4465 RepID=A0AAV9FIL1_ACOCL|nr:DEAD-box ATP-dependent RNA helicase 31 [Acorus calamus]